MVMIRMNHFGENEWCGTHRRRTFSVRYQKPCLIEELEDSAVNKLFKLKKWLTVPETAWHLSIVLDEEVGEADVLRLALDGHLKLSVNFVNHASATCGKVVPIENAKYREFTLEFVSLLPISSEHKGEPVMVLKGLNLNDKEVLELEKEVVKLDGIYDLSMIGNETFDVEHQYQQLTGGPEVKLFCLAGAFVSGDNETMYQLQESYDQNEYQSGSEAQLQKLKEHIAREDIEPPEAKTLLNQHKEKKGEISRREERKKRYGKGF